MTTNLDASLQELVVQYGYSAVMLRLKQLRFAHPNRKGVEQRLSEVNALLAEGKSPKEIANILSLTPGRISSLIASLNSYKSRGLWDDEHGGLSMSG